MLHIPVRILRLFVVAYISPLKRFFLYINIINGPWLNNGLKANEIDYNVTTLPQGSDSDKKQLF
ncbi:hypothetical protein EfmAA96_24560 [Enterococcus faecium]|nr:hypothetical protein EfmAA96_24560 [Enterococcus faecium]